MDTFQEGESLRHYGPDGSTVRRCLNRSLFSDEVVVQYCSLVRHSAVFSIKCTTDMKLK